MHREYNFGRDHRTYRPIVKLFQSLVVYKRGKKVPAKVKTVGCGMIDVTANGKVYTCSYGGGKWFVQNP